VGPGVSGVLEDGDVDDLGHRARDDLGEVGLLAFVDHEGQGVLVIAHGDVGDIGQGLAVDVVLGPELALFVIVVPVGPHHLRAQDADAGEARGREPGLPELDEVPVLDDDVGLGDARLE
jgi:hypothetical protein